MNRSEREEIAVLQEKVSRIEKSIEAMDKKLDKAIEMKADKKDLESFIKKSDNEDKQHSEDINSIKLILAKYTAIGATIATLVSLFFQYIIG